VVDTNCKRNKTISTISLKKKKTIFCYTIMKANTVPEFWSPEIEAPKIRNGQLAQQGYEKRTFLRRGDNNAKVHHGQPRLVAVEADKIHHRSIQSQLML
jgi:hypothetical protein